MKKENAIAGYTLNEIIIEAQQLAEWFGQFHQRISMPMETKNTVNMEDYSMHLSFQVGGWHELPMEERNRFSSDLRNTINQGFGVIEVNVWARWGGRFYNEELIEGTVASILIVDRRTRWDDGSYEPKSFGEARDRIRILLDNPPAAKLIGHESYIKA